jgi:hypothetical protein
MYSSFLQLFAFNSSSLARQRDGFLLLILAPTLFVLSTTSQAVSPPPDGGYPNQNTAEGTNALFSLTTGSVNTANGFNALFSNTTGGNNTATGLDALFSNTTGFDNTANGVDALVFNTTGTENTATGVSALQNNKTGSNNTANGVNALQNNSADNNTATGVAALRNNTSGGANTATGAGALASNTTASSNTATGDGALLNNTTGSLNTATGAGALVINTTGHDNTANGVNALSRNTAGSLNTANGNDALFINTTGNNNTAEGDSALSRNTTGSSNIALGFHAGLNLTTGSNNIDIGPTGVAGEANTIRIGKQGTQKSTFIAGIFGMAVTGSQVVVNSTGKLGVASSSARFKEAIKPMEKASEAILALKPVTFHYKEDIDPDGIPQFGLVAEEVEKVNPDLVVRGEDGKVMTVRYEAVNAMLLNEFLKAHRKVETLEGIVTQQQKQIEALSATVQKVSDQVAVSKPAPQLVTNP